MNITKTLIDAQNMVVETSKEKIYLLKDAIKAEDVAKVTKLVSEIKKEDPSLLNYVFKEEDGDNLAHIAVRAGNVEILAIIASSGIDLSAQNRRANTPICLAVQFMRTLTPKSTNEQRQNRKRIYQDISLLLIELDEKIEQTAYKKNLMRKDALDYLNKGINSPVVVATLQKRLAKSFGAIMGSSGLTKDSFSDQPLPIPRSGSVISR